MYGCVVKNVARCERYAIAIGAVSADRAERQALVMIRLMTGSDMGSLQLTSMISFGPITFGDLGDETHKQSRHWYRSQRALGVATFNPDQLLSTVFSTEKRTSGSPA